MHPVVVLKQILFGFGISVFVMSGFFMAYFSPVRSFAVYADDSSFGSVPDNSTLLNVRDAAYNLDDLIIDNQFILTDRDGKGGLPMRLKIPKINVDAPIAQMGLMTNGSMESPGGPRETGWFKFGPRPGDKGSSVIAGHYGRWESGEGSVFDNLNKLRKGDKLYVEDDRGNFIPFVVRETLVYNADDDPSDIFTSNDGVHLNLITCDGTWDPVKKDYSQRLVIMTDLNTVME